MKASERHRTRRENAFKLLTNHKAKRSKQTSLQFSTDLLPKRRIRG
jgi:hypothetical protein